MISIKLIFTAIANATRGTLKGGFPLINAVVEGIRNVKAKKAINGDEIKDAVNVSLKADSNGEPTTPHNWVSIIFQIAAGALMLYAFFTKQVTAESVLDLLSKLGGF